MITGKPGENYDDGVIGGYFGSDGNLIVAMSMAVMQTLILILLMFRMAMVITMILVNMYLMKGNNYGIIYSILGKVTESITCKSFP